MRVFFFIYPPSPSLFVRNKFILIKAFSPNGISFKCLLRVILSLRTGSYFSEHQCFSMPLGYAMNEELFVCEEVSFPFEWYKIYRETKLSENFPTPPTNVNFWQLSDWNVIIITIINAIIITQAVLISLKIILASFFLFFGYKLSNEPFWNFENSFFFFFLIKIKANQVWQNRSILIFDYKY